MLTHEFQAYLRQVQLRPLRTRILTTGVLSAFSELLSTWLAYGRRNAGPCLTTRIPKMAVYGAMVNAPLSHTLSQILQRALARQTGAKAKILQALGTVLLVSERE